MKNIFVMKRFVLYLFMMVVTLGFSSCKLGLDELPTFEEAELINFWFEHREVVEKTNPDGSKFEQVVFTDLKEICSFQKGEETNGVVKCVVTVNTAASPKTIDLKNIAGKANISTAALIEPINGSPVLGSMGNFSQPVTYMVTAADKETVKKYEISVVLK